MLKQLFRMTPKSRRLPGTGVLAGAIGGMMSAFVKLGWEVPFPPRAIGRIAEPQVLVTLFTHHPTSNAISLVIHFAFSILFGALYGGLVEFFPAVAMGLGTGFGLAVWFGAHEMVMPWMGLTPRMWDLPWKEQVSEFFGHALWGFAIEVFRAYFRAYFTKAFPLPIPKMEVEVPAVAN
jgi:putative membrane protein